MPMVREKHRDNQAEFREKWDRDLHWLPNWICPSEFFLWFDTPVTINAQTLMGKEKLLDRFGSYTMLDREIACRFLQQIPKRQRGIRWTNLMDAIASAPDAPVEQTWNEDATEPVTTVLSQVNTRRGQGKFRADLISMWNGACAVSSLTHSALLRASHIKPWAVSNNKEKRDPNNGLLLTANLDALFDKGLISFKNDGTMMVSSQLDAAHRLAVFAQSRLRVPPSDEVKHYLDFHRKNRFVK